MINYSISLCLWQADAGNRTRDAAARLVGRAAATVACTPAMLRDNRWRNASRSRRHKTACIPTSTRA